ncbi:MAG: hypothetical protein FWE67_09615 [Planctomycetaceae bacterium]|nr:hypothetical protein [Planctomycetaceae bacterium]
MFEFVVGFTLLLLGSICAGSFALPSKFVSKDLPWENLWGPVFLFVTLVLPLAAGPMLVPELFAIYAKVGVLGLLLPLMFGFMWGLGSMTLGLSFAFIGLSLAYGINYGGMLIAGSLGPMLIHTPEKIQTLSGIVILGGVAVCLVGIVLCGRAGVLKAANEANNAPVTEAEKPKKSALPGLLLALVSGVFCGCYSIAFSFAIPNSYAGGSSIVETTIAAGVAGWRDSLPATFLILFGGFFSACLYCVMKLNQNKTWKHFVSPKAVAAIVIAFIMAVLHDAALVFFGLAVSMLGNVSVSLAIFTALAIIVGNFNGFLTGEWRNAGRAAVRWIRAGIFVLVIAVAVLAVGRGLDVPPEPPIPANDVPVIESDKLETPITDDLNTP